MKAIIAALALAATAPFASHPAAIGQNVRVGPMKVRPVAVIEDSRCPINALCIQAGRIVVRTTIHARSGRLSRNLELRKPQQVPGGRLTLMTADPAPLAGVERKRPYRFTYRFEPVL